MRDKEIKALLKTLMECSHVLNHVKNKGRVGEQLQRRIAKHMKRYTKLDA